MSITLTVTGNVSLYSVPVFTLTGTGIDDTHKYSLTWSLYGKAPSTGIVSPNAGITVTDNSVVASVDFGVCAVQSLFSSSKTSKTGRLTLYDLTDSRELFAQRQLLDWAPAPAGFVTPESPELSGITAEQVALLIAAHDDSEAAHTDLLASVSAGIVADVAEDIATAVSSHDSSLLSHSAIVSTFPGIAAAAAESAVDDHDSDINAHALSFADYMLNAVADANAIIYAVTDDTPASLAMTANTFPARASTGNIEAKTVTDAMLSLLASASLDAAGVVTKTGDQTIAGDKTLSDSLYLALTTSALNGIVYKGTDTFLHDFTGAAPSTGANLFLGKNAGNLTNTSSNTIGIGDGSLVALTTGSGNNVFGKGAGESLTTGSRNNLFGYYAGASLVEADDNTLFGNYAAGPLVAGVSNTAFGSGAMGGISPNSSYNVAVGRSALYSGQVSYLGAHDYNIAIGYQAAYLASQANYIVAVGAESLWFAHSGADAVGVGHNAGTYYGAGDDYLSSPDGSIFIGRDTRAGYSTSVDEIVIGRATTGYGSNTVTLGNTSITKTVLRGKVGIGTTAPDRSLEVNVGAATGGLRLAYNDANGSATVYADVLVDSNGNLTLTPSGGQIICGGRLVLRTLASDPKDATPANRPAGTAAEVAYYSAKLYLCTNAATPTWELVQSA